MPTGKVPIPLTHIDDEPLVSLCVNQDWIPAIIAMVWPAKYPEFWGGTLNENRRARLEIQNLLVLLGEVGECDVSGCCLDLYVIQRVNPSTGMVEVSTDNGQHWQPQPGGLPTVIVEPVPPVTSGIASNTCDAATNIMTQIGGWITHVTNDFDTAIDIFAFGSAVIAAIADAILLILSAGTLTLIEAEIITALGAAITGAWLAGKEIFSGYWTDANKKIIRCALYENIGSDGAFTDAGFSAFWADCNTKLPGAIAKTLFIGFLSSIGRQGLNAMAASGTSSGADCTDCVSGCTLSVWSIYPSDADHYGVISSTDEGTGVITISTTNINTDGSYYILMQTDDDNHCCQILGFNNDVHPTGQAFTDCGTPRATALTDHAPTCVNTILYSSPAPFTIELILGGCP